MRTKSYFVVANLVGMQTWDVARIESTSVKLVSFIIQEKNSYENYKKSEHATNRDVANKLHFLI